MKITDAEISEYIDRLTEETGLHISLHGEIITDIKLVKYNFHKNPYCQYVKTVCGGWSDCVKKQKKVFLLCKNGDFFGSCYAGVGEYIYPLMNGDRVIGFISVSGYDDSKSASVSAKIKHFCQKYRIDENELYEQRRCYLSADITPKEQIDKLIRPLQRMLEVYYSYESRQESQTESDVIFKTVLRYINENHTAKITMQELSRRFNFSVSSISHAFKKKTGMSLSDYVNRLRLIEAEWLLRSSDFSVLQISGLLGFCSSAYFSTVFKKSYGLSPQEYRKVNKK